MLNVYGLYYAYPAVNENHQRLRVSLRVTTQHPYGHE